MEGVWLENADSSKLKFHKEMYSFPQKCKKKIFLCLLEHVTQVQVAGLSHSEQEPPAFQVSTLTTRLLALLGSPFSSLP